MTARPGREQVTYGDKLDLDAILGRLDRRLAEARWAHFPVDLSQEDARALAAEVRRLRKTGERVRAALEDYEAARGPSDTLASMADLRAAVEALGGSK